MILLQIAAGASTEPESLSVFDLIVEGGFMMIPILLLGLLAIYFFVERILVLKKADEDPGELMNRVKEFVIGGNIQAAMNLCGNTDTPASRMLVKGISKIGRPLKNIESSIENIGKIEVFNLEKNLAYLATISGAAPILGFLGTVIGMTKAFKAISDEAGSVSPKLLSSGLFTAMMTTIAGLIVGLLAYVAYNYLVARVQKIVHKMEYTTIDFIDLLQEPQ